MNLNQLASLEARVSLLEASRDSMSEDAEKESRELMEKVRCSLVLLELTETIKSKLNIMHYTGQTGETYSNSSLWKELSRSFQANK